MFLRLPIIDLGEYTGFLRHVALFAPLFVRTRSSEKGSNPQPGIDLAKDSFFVGTTSMLLDSRALSLQA